MSRDCSCRRICSTKPSPTDTSAAAMARMNIKMTWPSACPQRAPAAIDASAAELSITKALRLELNGTGLRVGTVDPGMAETEFSMVRLKGDAEKADAVYAGVEPLTAEDVAEAIVWAANRPPHVCIDEILMMCTAQAAPYKVHREG